MYHEKKKTNTLAIIEFCMYIRTIINNHNIMKCPKCQTEVAEVYKFCPKCRTRLQPVESSLSNGLNSVLPPPYK